MQVMSIHGAFNAYLFHMKLVESPNAPNVIKEGEMMMPGTPCLSVQHFKGRDDHSSSKNVNILFYTGQFGPNYAEKCRWMGPDGCLCRFDNALQDEDNVGVA